VSNRKRECRGTHRGKTTTSDGGNILMFDKDAGLDMRNELQVHAQSQIEAERMSAIGRMVCSISHDMRHSLSAIKG
jgi:C4-dicarboxylate-specific signal transduction histidine kinase